MTLPRNTPLVSCRLRSKMAYGSRRRMVASSGVTSSTGVSTSDLHHSIKDYNRYCKDYSSNLNAGRDWSGAYADRLLAGPPIVGLARRAALDGRPEHHSLRQLVAGDHTGSVVDEFLCVGG